jgi:hypothetical protein
VAGVLGFVAYAAVISSSTCADDLDAEITLFTTVFQGLGFLVALGIANMCYSLGGWLIRSAVPADRALVASRYAFLAALTSSLVLIGAIPLLAYFGCRASA